MPQTLDLDGTRRALLQAGVDLEPGIKRDPNQRRLLEALCIRHGVPLVYASGSPAETPVADLRMKALRLEEKENWPAARDAWNVAIDALGDKHGQIVDAMRHEFMARARSAHARADEPLGDMPAFKVQGLVDTKPEDDPDPGAAQHLDPGPTQTDAGAR